jgi:hypothetical protein
MERLALARCLGREVPCDGRRGLYRSRVTWACRVWKMNAHRDRRLNIATGRTRCVDSKSQESQCNARHPRKRVLPRVFGSLPRDDSNENTVEPDEPHRRLAGAQLLRYCGRRHADQEREITDTEAGCPM